MTRWLVAAELGVWLGRLIAGLLYCCVAMADEPPRTFVPCKIVSVHDGDTLICDIELPWNLTIHNQTVRVQGADAWEVSRTRRTVKVTDAEIEKGLKARDAVESLLKQADAVYLEPTGNRDPYGRVAARVHWWYDGKLSDLADFLKANGHTRTGK